MTLPKPIWSDGDVRVAWQISRNPSDLISWAWTTWNKDPTEIAVLRALVSCQARIGLSREVFCLDMGMVLAQNLVCFLRPYSLEVEGLHY